MERDRAIVKQWLAIYGAVLFRGFESADGAAEFEKVAQHLADAPLADVYLGTSPRVPVAGTKHVFTASEFAPWKVVPPHCEMSFLPSPPHFIAFFAASIPSDLRGGETPLIDMRGVTQQMDATVRKAFEDGGVRYIRRYPSADSTHPADVYDFFKTKTWQEMFGHAVANASSSAAASKAEDREAAIMAAVAAEARSEGFEPEWEARDGLKLTHELNAFRQHHPSADGEETEWLFHNHLMTLHSRSWADEFAFAAYVHRSPVHALLALGFYVLDSLYHALLGAEGLAQHVTHHGGAPIDSSHVWHVRRLFWRNAVIAPWQQGDLIVLDNMRVAHARMPFATQGKRKLWVAWTTE